MTTDAPSFALRIHRIHLSNSPPVFKHGFAISPRLSREFCFEFLPLRDQRRREYRAPKHPQPRVQHKKAHELVTTVTPGSPGIPRAMVLTPITRSPRCPGLLATVACASYRRLDPSVARSGPHALAVRGIAPSSLAPPASTASRPAFRDDREPPLCVGRDQIAIALIWPRRQAKFRNSENGTGAFVWDCGGPLRLKLRALSSAQARFAVRSRFLIRFYRRGYWPVSDASGLV
jgi:hypothetical protein